MNSIDLDICNQVEGYQIIYGKVYLISVWVVKGVPLDRFLIIVFSDGSH